MGVVKQIKDAVEGKKKSKAKEFLNGVKDWVTSPGGVCTLILFGIAMWYVHHRTEKKKAA